MLTDELAEKLYRQAHGSATAEAAALILIHALDGRLLHAVTLAWDDDDRCMAAIDWEATREATGYLSGGERRLLVLAASLASGHPVNLADALTGLDDRNTHVLLDAFAVAMQATNHRFDR